MKKWQLMFLLFAAVVMLFSVFGCGEPLLKNSRLMKKFRREEVVEEEAGLDADEVLMAAAMDYFEHVAAGNNNMTGFADIKEALDTDPDSILVIDIRGADDFEEAHIPGSVFADRSEVAGLMSRIPQDKPVYIACFSGQNAGYTVAYLRMAGFDNVTSMAFGINLGWVERGGFSLDGTGMVLLSDMPEVSAPRDEAEEIIWARAAEYGAEIAAGQIGFIPIDAQQELYDSIQADPTSAVIYDIRAATGGDDDFDKYHIEHSNHIPWGQFGTLLADLPTDIPVIIGCYSGQTAAQTLGVLRMLGFDNARSILYGVRDGWVGRADLPVVTP
jgi:rhodanese-related sulfurtransferase